MVSNASEDFPEPLKPVITVKVLRGISTSIFFRLCCRAPCTVMRLSMGWKIHFGGGGVLTLRGILCWVEHFFIGLVLSLTFWKVFREKIKEKKQNASPKKNPGRRETPGAGRGGDKEEK